MTTRPSTKQIDHDGVPLDEAIAGLSGDHVTTGTITNALGYLPVSSVSPVFSGQPTAPTAALGTNSQQLATTAFVQAAVLASSGAGSGDMTRAVYDPDGDGKVLAASTADTVPLEGVVGLAQALAGKQAQLVSGSTLKTVNGISLLGAGNLVVAGVGGGAIDVVVAGADPTGVADCYSLVQGLITANKNNTKGFCLLFPPGKYRFSAALQCTLTGDRAMSVVGYGSDVSVLYFPTSSGLDVTYTDTYWSPSPDGNSLHVQGVSVTCGSQNTATAISVKGNTLEGRPAQATVLQDVCCRGDTGGHVWNTGLELYGVSGVHCTNYVCYGANNTQLGTGIRIANDGNATHDPVEFNFTNCRMFFLEYGVHCVGNEIEGLNITNCTLVQMRTGVQWLSATPESAIQINNCHISAVYCCIHLRQVYDSTIYGNTFFQAKEPEEWYGLRLDHSTANVFGNIFMSANKTSNVGIALVNTVDTDFSWANFQGSAIVGNSFRYMPLGIGASAYTGNAVIAASNVFGSGVTPYFLVNSQVTVEKKRFSTTTTRVLAGGSTQEIVYVALPVNHYFNKAGFGSITVSSDSNQNIVGYYDFNHSSNSKTLAVFVVRMRDGGALPAGPVRFNVDTAEHNFHEA